MQAVIPEAESLEGLRQLIEQRPAVAVYFSGPDCGVCHALEPKLAGLFAEHFPEVDLFAVDCAAQPEIAAQYGVFSVPVLLVFFDSREGLRKSRNVSITELKDQLQRPYSLIFTDG